MAKQKVAEESPMAKPSLPKEKPKAPPAPSVVTVEQPSRPSGKEPQLPPKERERRVSFIILLLTTHKVLYSVFCIRHLHFANKISGSYDKTQETCGNTFERCTEHFCHANNIQ